MYAKLTLGGFTVAAGDGLSQSWLTSRATSSTRSSSVALLLLLLPPHELLLHAVSVPHSTVVVHGEMHGEMHEPGLVLAAGRTPTATLILTYR